MKLSDVLNNPRNPRTISEEKKDALKKSLSEFGDLSGLVFNRTTGHWISGHQRNSVIPQDTEIQTDGKRTFIEWSGNEYQVRIVEWDEVKERAAMVAANQHGGEWNFQMLVDELTYLDSKNIDLDLTGWLEKEREDLFAPIQDPRKKTIERFCKPGDVWILGQHTLHVGELFADECDKLVRKWEECSGGRAKLLNQAEGLNVTEWSGEINGTQTT